MRELTSMTPFAVKLLCGHATGRFVLASTATVSFAGGLRGRLSKLSAVGGGKTPEVVELEVRSQARHGLFVCKGAQKLKFRQRYPQAPEIPVLHPAEPFEPDGELPGDCARSDKERNRTPGRNQIR
jgi:hypothetical protein